MRFLHPGRLYRDDEVACGDSSPFNFQSKIPAQLGLSSFNSILLRRFFSRAGCVAFAADNGFDRTGHGFYTGAMEVRFTPEEEARLTKIATQEGVHPEELVKDAALRLLGDDTRFRAGVRKGIEQADRGEFIEEEEMDARVKRMFQP